MTKTTNKGICASLLTAGALVLTACGSEEEPTAGDTNPPAEGETEEPTQASGTITIASDQEFTAYNAETADQNGVWNNYVLNGVQKGFWSYGSDGSIVRETDFGTYEKVSDDPLTVSLTIADNVVWSDGEPIDCDDVLLDWAAKSGTFIGEREVEVEDEEGNVTTETEDGVNIFNPVSTTGYELVAKPECEAGDKSFEYVYSETFSDWELFPEELMPAHVVAEQVGLTSDELIAAIKSDDVAALQPVAEFWNTGWTFEQGQLPDPSLIPASGPYVIESWDAGQSITLTANPEYYGTPPKTGTIIIRFLAQDQQVPALENGEVDLISPQPSVDLFASLEALGDQVQVLSGNQMTWEHVDMQQGPGRVFEDPQVRRAFAKCIPRDVILSNLVQPVNPDAELMNAREFLPFSDSYQEAVDASFPSDVLDPNGAADVAGAQALLDEAGVEQPVTVRFMHAADNQRRADTAALIKSSCDEAGFDVQPFPDPDWGSKLVGAVGEYDATLFGWAGSGVISSGAAIYQTAENLGDNQNFYGYSNSTVDQLWDEVLRTTDLDQSTQLRIQIEEQLWADMFNVPLFAHPGITAAAADIEGVVHNATQTGHTFNMDELSRAS